MLKRFNLACFDGGDDGSVAITKIFATLDAFMSRTEFFFLIEFIRYPQDDMCTPVWSAPPSSGQFPLCNVV